MPPSGAALVIVGATDPEAMTIVTFCVAFGIVPLAACTTKLKVPVAVGVPERTPVLVFRVRPAGSVPLMVLHVNGAVPLAVKLWL